METSTCLLQSGIHFPSSTMSPALLSSITLMLSLLLFPFRPSLCQQEVVVLKLAEGGTSRPHRLLPLHDHHKDPQLPSAAPQLGLRHEEDMSASTQEQKDKSPKTTIKWQVTQARATVLPNGKRSVDQDDAQRSSPDSTTGGYQSTLKPTEISSTKVTTTTTMKPTELSTWTPEKSTTLSSSTNPFLTTVTSTPPSACHQECRAALNATRLHPHTSLTLRQGSELTLQCEVPLAPSLVMENLVWLYQSDDIAKGQCSLTTQPFLPSCQGFQTIKHIYDRNATLIRDTISVGNLQANYSGQYMCQVSTSCYITITGYFILVTTLKKHI